jgi:hypothetical protein
MDSHSRPTPRGDAGLAGAVTLVFGMLLLRQVMVNPIER